jgi:hypothetical protein
MTKRSFQGVVLGIFFHFSSEIADSQVITGNVLGTVRDETGAVLPGAAATIASPEPRSRETFASCKGDLPESSLRTPHDRARAPRDGRTPSGRSSPRPVGQFLPPLTWSDLDAAQVATFGSHGGGRGEFRDVGGYMSNRLRLCAFRPHLNSPPPNPPFIHRSRPTP